MTACVTTEVAVRCFEPAQAAEDAAIAATANQYEFYQFDSILGWSNTPGARGTFRRQEFSYDVRINRLGMRDREVDFATPVHVPRIAVLGDSFVWGIGVSDAERFTDLLRAETGLDLLNFGVSGYGPVQYLLMLDRVLEFDPRLVLLCFCLDNDYSDCVLRVRYGYCKPYATRTPDGRLQISGYPLFDNGRMHSSLSQAAPALARFLYQYSALYRLWQRVASQPIDASNEQAGLSGFVDELVYRSPESLSPSQRRLRDQAVAVNRAVIGAIHNKLARRGVGLALVAVPTKHEYPPAGGPNRCAADTIGETASDLAIPFINPVDSMSLADFWNTDGHWNPQGHRRMCAAIHAWLKAHGWCRPFRDEVPEPSTGRAGRTDYKADPTAGRNFRIPATPV